VTVVWLPYGWEAYRTRSIIRVIAENRIIDEYTISLIDSVDIARCVWNSNGLCIGGGIRCLTSESLREERILIVRDLYGREH
jgi:hypothetical protein